MKNENVYVEGYVEIPKDVEEFEDWYFTDRNGFHQYQQQYIHHDEIEWKATDKQITEIEEFDLLINSKYIDFVNDVILNSEEDENKIYIKNDIKIIINEGAKFEIEIEDYNDFQYCMGFKLFFNNEQVFLNDDDIFEDPYTYEESPVKDIIFEKGAYVIEIPKSYFDFEGYDLSDREKEEIIGEYKEAWEKSYAKSLVAELGVYGIAYNLKKEELLSSENPIDAMNEGLLDSFANSIEQSFEELSIDDIYYMSDKHIEKIIKDDESLENL